MTYKKLRNVRSAVVILCEAMSDLNEEIVELDDTGALFELVEVTRELQPILERLVKFDVHVAERKLNGEKRVDNPVVVN